MQDFIKGVSPYLLGSQGSNFAYSTNSLIKSRFPEKIAKNNMDWSCWGQIHLTAPLILRAAFRPYFFKNRDTSSIFPSLQAPRIRYVKSRSTFCWIKDLIWPPQSEGIQQRVRMTPAVNNKYRVDPSAGYVRTRHNGPHASASFVIIFFVI